MQHGTMKVDGAVTFWTACEATDREQVRLMLDAQGLGEFLPAPRETVACLRCALQEVVGGPRVLVRPLKKNTGFTVIQEERGDDTNAYPELFTAKVDEDGFIRFSDYDSTRQDKILTELSAQRHYLGSTQVTDMLVNILGHLGGTRLKPTGGVYWLRDAAMGTWKDVVAMVERASAKGENKVYVIRHDFDADSMRAVRDAIVQEITQETLRVHGEVSAGELGERGLEFRKEACLAMREKIRTYEEILGEGLGALTQNVEAVEMAAAEASLMLSAQQGQAVLV